MQCSYRVEQVRARQDHIAAGPSTRWQKIDQTLYVGGSVDGGTRETHRAAVMVKPTRLSGPRWIATPRPAIQTQVIRSPVRFKDTTQPAISIYMYIDRYIYQTHRNKERPSNETSR